MNEKQRKIAPRVLKGFRDYPPSEQLAREELLSELRRSFELMGFLPLQTPSLEFAETLLGNHYTPETLAELFGFRGPDDTDMALRYEFTVSLARFVASQPNLPLPFRRYQYGNVWRVDKPGPGRYREFMQFDIDIVGSPSLLADAEVIAAMVSTMERFRPVEYRVRYSSRKILNGLVEWAGVSAEQSPDVLRVIDKLEKQGIDAVIAELGAGRIDSSGDKITGLQLNAQQIERIGLFLSTIQGRDGTEQGRSLLEEVAAAQAGFADLQTIAGSLRDLGVSEEAVAVDLTIVRGLGYYTGTVFETTLTKLPEYGSVFSGGRYDNLVDRFLGRSIPAVGASIGIDRLLAALIALQALPLREATSEVLVTIMDQERLPDYLKLVSTLRQAGIACELFVGETKNLTRQIKYGDKVGIPFAVIAGSNEFANGTVMVKNLHLGRERAASADNRDEWLKAEGIQEEVKQSELIHWLQEKLRQLRKGSLR